jgi:ADP-ribose pyrophosphatase
MGDEERSGDKPGELKRVGGKLVHKGPIASVRMDRFRYPDGSSDVRQVVVHPGAVCIAAHDGKVLYMVRQPREPVEEPALLELPAGKLDKEGESPLESAKRELAEEIGKQAAEWEELGSFYTSPGFADEEVHLFLATGISDVDERPVVEHDERIDVEVRPLADLDAILAETKDSNTQIGLYRLRERLSRRTG